MNPNQSKPDMLDMLLKYANKQGKYDASGYPQDVQATILAVCEHWQIPPPRYKTDKAYWIEGARRLQDACGEFGNDLIAAYRQEYVKQTLEKKGIPFTVEGPNSLIKVMRAFAGQVRSMAMNPQVESPAEKKHLETIKMLEGLFND